MGGGSHTSTENAAISSSDQGQGTPVVGRTPMSDSGLSQSSVSTVIIQALDGINSPAGGRTPSNGSPSGSDLGPYEITMPDMSVRTAETVIEAETPGSDRRSSIGSLVSENTVIVEED